jgi:quercetin dioxygenase-like cupin family protein
MDTVNAIAKVRFASAKPQAVHLHKGKSLQADLLCMEPGQKLDVPAAERLYYVVAGTAKLSNRGDETTMSAGQLAATAGDERHRIANPGPQRLICVIVRGGS